MSFRDRLRRQLARAPGTPSAGAPLGDVAGAVGAFGGEALDGFVLLESQSGRGAVPDVEALGRWVVGVAGEDAASWGVIDIETTGLGRGEGTLAFLVGVARWVPAGLLLRQYLLCDLDAEVPFLSAVAAEAEALSAVVTYNGRSFDEPMLRGRLERLGMSLPVRPHVDLLHVLRRLRPGMRRHTLEWAERAVLQRPPRVDDVPGALAPRAFADFVRRGDTRALGRVVRHNAMDVSGLAALASWVADVFRDPRKYATRGDEVAGVASYVADGKDFARAAAMFGVALAKRRSLTEPVRVARAFALSLKRSGVAPDGVLAGAFEGLLEFDEVLACELLAKHEEHTRKNPAAALQWAERGLRAAAAGKREHAFRRRIERLTKHGPT